MSTHKNIDKICVAAILLALIITVLFMNGENLGLKKTVDTDAERYSATEYFTSNDLNSGTIDFSDAVKITLKEDSASVSGNGAYVWDGVVTIVRSGYYTVSGTGQNLRIVVDAEEYSKVWIELNGVTMTCEDDACLQIEEADKVFVVLAEGTENSLQSGAAYSDSAVAAGHDAALFSREDLTITGSGSLAVTSEYRHGIACNDDLVITGGTISVTAAGDGLHANDSIRICNADLTINAEEEGIQTDEENSWLYIESGKLDITSTDDSIKSAGDITIAGGDITISSGDDGIRSDTKVTVRSGTVLINTCYEGIEAKIVEIHDGDITIYPEDDGINANGGSAGMNQGMFNPMGGSNEETAGMNMPVNRESEERPEGAETTDQTVSQEKPEKAENTDAEAESKAAETAEEETHVLIAGGRVTIVNEAARDADGIDSNGSVIITGGDIRVSLTGSGTNNAIDYGSESGSTAVISGGTLVASGSSNMAESFDSSSQQVSIMYNISSGMESDTVMTLKDEEGTVLLSETIPCSFSSLILSCPELTIGKTYTLSLNETEITVVPEEVNASFGDAQNSPFGGQPGSTEEGSQGNVPMDPGGRPEENGGMPPEMTERPEGMPEMMERPDGMMNRRREAGENSAAAEGSEMNQNADRSEDAAPESFIPEENSTQTEMTGEPAPQDPHSMAGQEERTQSGEEKNADASEETETAAATDPQTAWMLCGLSAAVLIAGLVIVKFLKGKSVFS